LKLSVLEDALLSFSETFGLGTSVDREGSLPQGIEEQGA
jgi:hypothetical protein